MHALTRHNARGTARAPPADNRQISMIPKYAAVLSPSLQGTSSLTKAKAYGYTLMILHCQRVGNVGIISLHGTA